MIFKLLFYIMFSLLIINTFVFANEDVSSFLRENKFVYVLLLVGVFIAQYFWFNYLEDERIHVWADDFNYKINSIKKIKFYNSKKIVSKLLLRDEYIVNVLSEKGEEKEYLIRFVFFNVKATRIL